jgi:putative transposase
MAETTVRTFRRSFKCRLYPTKAQVVTIEHWLDLCRELHNAAIEERREAWAKGISVGFAVQSQQLPAIKTGRPEFAEINAQVLQQALRRVDLAFSAFFRRVKRGETPGYPRFKSRDRYNSLTWPQAIGFKVLGRSRIHLSKIGQIRAKIHRPLEGEPKTCAIKREAGRWYAIFSCDQVPARSYPKATAEVGIDMGLTTFAALSTGEMVTNPKWYRAIEGRLVVAQRKLSSKQKKSKRRKKARERVARLHQKAANQRRDFQHKLARQIVSENKFIAVENLAPKKMAEKSWPGMAKSILDASWGRFLSILSEKAEEAARTLVKVPPHGTSSTCFQCGAYRKKTLSERTHSCPCGLVLDRDFHASLNILRLGRSLRTSA